jgi:hypothetical protein
MIKLADILKEVEAEPVITDLNYLDDEIKKAIENAPKNEVIGTITFALAVPGIINAIMKIIEIIAKKSGINLKKKNDPAWYKIIGKVTEEIDNYIDAPFRFMLKPFISDNAKREKIAKLLKAATLTLLVIYGVIYGAVDITKIKDTTDLINQLIADLGIDLSINFAQMKVTTIGEAIKKISEILKLGFNTILQVAK